MSGPLSILGFRVLAKQVVVFRCLTIRGVHNYDTRHLQWGVDFLKQTKGIFPFEKLVTKRFTLDKINQAMSVARSGKAIRVAVLP